MNHLCLLLWNMTFIHTVLTWYLKMLFILRCTLYSISNSPLCPFPFLPCCQWMTRTTLSRYNILGPHSHHSVCTHSISNPFWWVACRTCWSYREPNPCILLFSPCGVLDNTHLVTPRPRSLLLPMRSHHACLALHGASAHRWHNFILFLSFCSVSFPLVASSVDYAFLLSGSVEKISSFFYFSPSLKCSQSKFKTSAVPFHSGG